MSLFKNKPFLIVVGIIFLSLSIWGVSFTFFNFNFDVERVNLTRECLEDIVSFDKIDGDYPIKEEFSVCEKDSDCVRVETECDPCCSEGSVINSIFLDGYTSEQQLYCEKYHKSFCYEYQAVRCSCMVRKMTTRCVDNKCVIDEAVDVK